MCNTVQGPCAAMLKNIMSDPAAQGLNPTMPINMRRGDILFPAAASCAKCEREQTIGQDLARCSSCKLTMCVIPIRARNDLAIDRMWICTGTAGKVGQVFFHHECLTNTRFSADCQKADWPRHKGNCRIVKDVKWVWT